MRKNTGKSFEKAIADICDIYEAKGIARIKRTSPLTATVFNPKTKKSRITYLKNNPHLDFAGVYLSPPTNDRVHLLIECKDIDKNNLPIYAKKYNGAGGGITESEFNSLRKWNNFSYTMLLWRRGNEVRKLDGDHIIEIVDDGGKSISWDICRPVKDYDFLEVL